MTPQTQDAESRLDLYRALLEVSESISLNRDLPDLFHDLAARLKRIVRFDFLILVLYEPGRHTMRLHVLETSEATTLEPGLELRVDETPSGWVWETQQPLIMTDLEGQERYPKMRALLEEQGVRSGCLLPLTTAHRRLGVLGFGSKLVSGYSPADLEFLQQIAAQVAVAVDNALNFESSQRYQRQLARERDRLRAVLDVTNALVSNLNLRDMFRVASEAVRRVIPHDYTSLVLEEPGTGMIRIDAMDFASGPDFIQVELAGPIDGTPAGVAMETGKPILVDRLDAERFPSDITRRLTGKGLKSCASVPLVRGGRVLGAMSVAARSEGVFTSDDLDLLSQIANEVSIAVENAVAYQQIAELKDKLATEKLYLEDEIRTEYNFEEMVGESAAWKRVLRDIETVAPTDSTVLIQGESGTGKELIARAIHDLSNRRERTLVKVNCAAIPTGLLESELFGHEKGAFTGAITQRIGRFELASGGTLLLDEIGDIPLELQPKLLRVLQEREFERLGGTRTIRADVRLITSTNRNLGQMVAAHEFRGDLYYRLNVFPITVPPLRERREDIPLLVSYFTQKLARRMSRHIETVPAEAMDAMMQWHWPGNVRELENFIERAVILSPGPVLRVPLAELGSGAATAAALPGTLEELERRHILQALEDAGWVIGGASGAAARLGLKRTTLQSRMEKLGIRRPRPRALLPR